MSTCVINLSKIDTQQAQKRMDLFIEPWQSIYFKHVCYKNNYKCDILGIHCVNTCDPNKILYRVRSFSFTIRLPDAALNRLSKATGFDYLSRGHIRMIPYGVYPCRVPIHIYKNSEHLHDAENGLGRCCLNAEANNYDYGPKNPWLPKVTIEYISGIGISVSAGFADITVSTIDI